MAAEQDFQDDVFLSHSAKDRAVARPLAERFRAGGLRIQPLAFSLQLLLRDPLIQERRFIPLRLDDAPSIKGSLRNSFTSTDAKRIASRRMRTGHYSREHEKELVKLRGRLSALSR